VPKGPRKFHFSFEKAGLTRFGGLSLFQSFCKSLGLRHFLQLYVRWPDYHRRNYHPADLFLAHLFSMVAGIGRIENAQSLIHNGLIPPLLGLPEFPHRDTLRSFLWRFGPNEFDNLVAAHDRLRHDFFHRLGLLHSAIVDADTTALLTYGHQEGVAVGFVPKKRHGQPSYAPIISSEGRCGLTLGMELRAGNVHSTIGALSFLNQMLDKLPSSIAATRTRLRLDGAFYDRKIIEAIDQERIGYAVSAKMTRPLRNKMIAARYQPFAQGWEAAAFSYMPFRWQKQHRFVAVRRAAALEPESIQQRLFTFKQYTYHQALVTNLEPTPAAVWRFYCDRGFQELLLREFKGSYTMAKIPTRSFWANAAYMEMVLWAYDLVLAFQYLCLPEEIRNWNIATLRRELWWLPAEWVRRENRNVLVLPAKYPRQDLFLKIQQASEKVRPII
jgi:Transposase DDE domain group 1